MKRVIRSVASMMVMAVFLILALASDDDDPLAVLYGHGQLEECKWLMTPITKNQEVFIKVVDRITKKPISGVTVSYHITPYFVVSDETDPKCLLEAGTEKRFVIQTGIDGYFYISNDRVYKTESEFTVIKVSIEKEGYVPDNGYSISYDFKDSSFKKDIYLLPIQVRP